ncbi:hypothetical protein HMPREF0004_4959 [Achromobacter piechaudii ATCC 43553]|uniref:Uncharacterized protein n=1 Tax=Achromobacter piechaudii ATCC 43553 TaxID=742159 RepID=D4XHL2_9BURK|nr:hypothetical protein HMPREF0004_4959 [Achromobacter piechaudii ATCC 43553]
MWLQIHEAGAGTLQPLRQTSYSDPSHAHRRAQRPRTAPQESSHV